MSNAANNENALKEDLSDCGFASGESGSSGIDISLLKDSLAKTPWERMQANDDALNFAESLRAAMKKHDAKS
ncbi:MAG: hypothetical protein M3Y82_06490 [Verrucomicrobiota bacterium]|nr:hypothetical protein [Verrucomicrobiota bacterium]